MNLPRSEVLIEEVFSGFVFVRGKGIHFPNLWGKGVVKVDLMVIGSGRKDMVSGFF